MISFLSACSATGGGLLFYLPLVLLLVLVLLLLTLATSSTLYSK